MQEFIWSVVRQEKRKQNRKESRPARDREWVNAHVMHKQHAGFVLLCILGMHVLI